MKDTAGVMKTKDMRSQISSEGCNRCNQVETEDTEKQIGTLRDVINGIRADENKPSVDSISSELNVMPASGKTSTLTALQHTHGNSFVQRVISKARHSSEVEEDLRSGDRSSPDIEASVKAMRGGGQPLPEQLRASIEPQFGYDFSQVRVHTDSRASESAKSVNALAFTTGKDIIFAAGQYSPQSISGRRLIAHELTHVVQQASGPVSGTQKGNVFISHPADSFEKAADRTANAIVDQASVSAADIPMGVSPISAIQRKEITAGSDIKLGGPIVDDEKKKHPEIDKLSK
jgi:hypothetical protein